MCVWQLATGRLRARFADTHGGVRVTAMAFDGSYRRLITGVSVGQCGAEGGKLRGKVILAAYVVLHVWKVWGPVCRSFQAAFCSKQLPYCSKTA